MNRRTFFRRIAGAAIGAAAAIYSPRSMDPIEVQAQPRSQQEILERMLELLEQTILYGKGSVFVRNFTGIDPRGSE